MISASTVAIVGAPSSTWLCPWRQPANLSHTLSILGDYHRAEDATQEAFVSAYFGLTALREPAAFAGWLRGIVRNHCLRLVRGHRPSFVPLDTALDVAGPGAGPEEQAEQAELRERVLQAVMDLPDGQREIVALYYLGEHSQGEIAGFLELPVTTVNNRLYAARQRLKGGLMAMARDDLRKHGLAADFAAKVGTVIAVRGPVIEAQFGAESTPEPLDMVTLEEHGTLAVMQQLQQGRVRCITLTDQAPLERGLAVTNTQAVVRDAVSPDILRAAVAILVRPGGEPTVIETGIKALDLFCPLSAGGTFSLYGPAGAGKLVLLGELLHRLTSGEQLTVLNFVQTGAAALMRPPNEDRLPNAAGPIQTFYLPVNDAAEPSSHAVQAVHEALRAAVYLSRAMAQAYLYPAIDPLASWSRLLTADAVGEKHLAVAEEVRRTLHMGPARTEQPDDAELVENDPTLATARRLRAYLTQPFFTTEAYTNMPGEWVPAAQTVDDCHAILSGRYNHLAVEAFPFGDTLEQILANVRAKS